LHASQRCVLQKPKTIKDPLTGESLASATSLQTLLFTFMSTKPDDITLFSIEDSKPDRVTERYRALRDWIYTCLDTYLGELQQLL